MGRVARIVVIFGAAGLVAAAVLAELGEHWWRADLFAHFRFHYLAIGAVLLGAALLIRRGWLTILVIAACAPHLWSLFAFPAAPVATATAEAARAGRLRLVSLNLYYGNRSLDRVAAYLRHTGGDIVCLQEVTGHLWAGLRQRLKQDYPHWSAEHEARGDNLILSRHPLRAVRFGDPLAEAVAAPGKTPDSVTSLRTIAVMGAPDWARRFRYVEAVAETPRGALRILCGHPPVPMSRPLAAIHALHLGAFTRQVRASSLPVVVIGDMNLTPYSPRFRAWMRQSGLRPAPRTLLWPATWPAYGHQLGLVALVPGIPIDHVLLGPGLASIRTWRGDDVGSDHFPVAADVRLGPRAGR